MKNFAFFAASLSLLLAACEAPQNLQTGHLDLRDSQGIIGGQKVNPADQAARQAHRLERVKYTKGTMRKIETGFCTSSLIDKRLLLTAEHCLPDADGRGSMTAHFILPNGKEKVIPAVDWIRSKRRDLALLKLAEDAPDSAEIFDLPESQKDYHPKEVEMLGYGYVTGNPKEKPEGRTLRKKTVKVSYLVVPADFFYTEMGGCFGDSGAPVLFKTEEKTVLLGVQSEAQKESRDALIACTKDNMIVYLPWAVRWIENAAAEVYGRSTPTEDIVVEKR